MRVQGFALEHDNQLLSLLSCPNAVTHHVLWNMKFAAKRNEVQRSSSNNGQLSDRHVTRLNSCQAGCADEAAGIQFNQVLAFTFNRPFRGR